MTVLGAGEIRVHGLAGVRTFAVLGGHVVIEPERITVLALFASPEEERLQIEEACRRARAALELAENAPPALVEEGVARLRIELARRKRERG